MDTSILLPALRRLLLGLLTWAAAGAQAAGAADADPPGRVGRLAALDGPVSLFDGEQRDWRSADPEADRNRPLTEGDRLATGARARAEARIGSTVLRLGERSEVELQRLDDERLVLRVHRGSLALRVATAEMAEELELVTGELRAVPARAGLYRIDRRLDGERDRTLVQAWRGLLRVDGGPAVAAGERLLLWREGARLRQETASAEPDEFADWVAREDRRDARLDEAWAQAGEPRVPREMTGAEELARHGRWDRHPEHGWVWLPTDVAPGWAPYREGRWVWLRPWGWTWVDRAPWGFATVHYGRWVAWNGRWVWWPGAYVKRPVFSPALVVWSGTPSVNVSVHIGGPGVGWAPLPPRTPYRPWYRHSERHIERVDPWVPAWGPRPVRPAVPDSALVRPIERVQAQLPRPPAPVMEWRTERRDERRDDRRDERRDERRDDRRDDRWDDRWDDRRDDRRDTRPAPRRDAAPPARQAPPAAMATVPAPAAPVAAPGPARSPLERALQQQREQAARNGQRPPARQDDAEGRRQIPRPGERAAQH